MADILLSKIAGSGIPGGTITRTVSGTIDIPVSSSGTLATITCPSDRVAKLYHLVSTNDEIDITIEINGVPVISATTVTLGNSTISDGQICLGGDRFTDISISGGKGEDIVIKKDTGSTSATIRYAYQLLE